MKKNRWFYALTLIVTLALSACGQALKSSGNAAYETAPAAQMGRKRGSEPQFHAV